MLNQELGMRAFPGRITNAWMFRTCVLYYGLKIANLSVKHYETAKKKEVRRIPYTEHPGC